MKYLPNNKSQNLITSKSRLVKRNLTIPRLELIAAQLFKSLAQNIKNALNNQNVIIKNFKISRQQLNLKMNREAIYKRHGSK